MDIQEYRKARQELLGLVDDLADKVKDTPEAQTASLATLALVDGGQRQAGEKNIEATESVTAVLKGLHDKLAEDRFRVALLAGFQSGKSTTFNTFMDGQEISPRGTMIATSAAIIYGQHSDDPALQGKARITWKSDEELIQMLPTGVFAQLKSMPQLAKRLEEVDTLDQLSQVLCLDDKADLAALREACEAEWMVYASNRGKYDKDDFALLRVAYVMLQKVDTPAIREARANLRLIPIEEIAELVQFPEKWDLRFIGETPEPFDDAECRFIFVKKVECFVRSPALKKAGCTIVDCPGLSSSAYDTNVAISELKDCDAVWFLMGDKQVSDSELDTIKKMSRIKPNGLLFSVNMRESKRKLITEQIIPADRARINQRVTREDGNALVSETDNIFPYHARLALTAEQAQRVSEDALTQHSMDAILYNTRRMVEETDDVREALTMAAEDDLKNVGVSRQELRGFTLFDEEGKVVPEAVALMHEQSNFGAIVDAIEGIVARDRPRIVLKDNGAVRLRTAWKTLSAELHSTREKLSQTQANNKERFEKTKAKANTFLKEFDTDCKEELDENLEDLLVKPLCGDFNDHVLQCAKRAIEDAAKSQVDNLMSLDEEARNAKLASIVNEEFKLVVSAWQDHLQQDASELFGEYQKIVEDMLNRLNTEAENRDPESSQMKVDIKGLADKQVSIGKIDLGIDWLNVLSIASWALVFVPVIGPLAKIAKLLSVAKWGASLLSFLGLAKSDDRKKKKFLDEVSETVGKALKEQFPKEDVERQMRDVANEIHKSVRAKIHLILNAYLKRERAELDRLREIAESGKTEQNIARIEALIPEIEQFGTRLETFEKQLAASL